MICFAASMWPKNITATLNTNIVILLNTHKDVCTKCTFIICAQIVTFYDMLICQAGTFCCTNLHINLYHFVTLNQFHSRKKWHSLEEHFMHILFIWYVLSISSSREKKSPAMEHCQMGKTLCPFLTRLQNQVGHCHKQHMHIQQYTKCNSFRVQLFTGNLEPSLKVVCVFFQMNQVRMTELPKPILLWPAKKIWWSTSLI